MVSLSVNLACASIATHKAVVLSSSMPLLDVRRYHRLLIDTTSSGVLSSSIRCLPVDRNSSTVVLSFLITRLSVYSTGCSPRASKPVLICTIPCLRIDRSGSSSSTVALSSSIPCLHIDDNSSNVLSPSTQCFLPIENNTILLVHR